MKTDKILILLLMGAILSLPASAYERIYDIQLNIAINDQTNLHYAKIIDGYKTIFPNSPQEYSIKIYSENSEELLSEYFVVSFSILTSPPAEWEMNETVVDLRIAYQKNAKVIKIFRESKEIFSFDISNFCNKDKICGEYENEISCPQDCSQTTNETTQAKPNASEYGCGNNICDSSETYFTCPSDCKSGEKDGYCDRVKDGKCDPDCRASEDSDCTESIEIKKEDSTSKILIAAIFGVILLFVVLFIVIKIKSGSEK
jgi:hypothetical protein